MEDFQIDTSGGEAPPPMVVRSRDFEALALVMKFIGGIITLFGVVFLFLSDARIVAAMLLTVGLLYVLFAFAFESFKRWAWVGTVVLLLPLALLMSIVGGVLHEMLGILALFPAVAASSVLYVGWVLLSKHGRSRYFETVDAIERAKADPQSAAGQFLSRSRLEKRRAMLRAAAGAGVVVASFVVILVVHNWGRSGEADNGLTDPPAVLDDAGNVRNLIFQDSSLTDQDLAIVAHLTQIVQLNITRTQATDRTLRNIQRLTTLEVLDLERTGVTDDGMKYLAELPLESLYVKYTAVGDAGVEQIAKLPKLKRLSLEGTQVTDAGMAALKGCLTLQRLDVRNTAVTSAGADDLKQTLTWCRVLYDK